MNNLPLQPLVWKDGDICSHIKASARSPLHGYFVSQTSDNDEVSAGYYENGGKTTRYATGFATIDEAKQWAWNHYNEKMQLYVKPDSITDIRNWFKAAKPEPTSKDITTQIGCHYEEVAEMDVALGSNEDYNHKVANFYKKSSAEMSSYTVDDIDRNELLDALCDQIVTATGVAYMMGFDIEGALKEVIRSNNSKMVDGKFEFDDNGKIAKPDSYSEPDLTPFISTMQNLHKESDCE